MKLHEELRPLGEELGRPRRQDEVLVADPGLFVASLCPPDGSTDFDSVVTIYQDPTASPVSFNPAAPCTNAITASDDVCGSGSEAAATLQAGYAIVVVSSWTVGGIYKMKIFFEERDWR